MTDNPHGRAVPLYDAGRAAHFHGRDALWSGFLDILTSACLTSGGTVVLVQGPSGAGKTAILHEFGDRVNSMRSWAHHHIDIDALHRPARLARMLGDSSYADRRTSSTEGTTTVGGKVVIHGQRSWHTAETAEHAGLSVEDLLMQHAANSGLLLTVDEVQDMAVHRNNNRAKAALMCILRSIRNGTLRSP